MSMPDASILAQGYGIVQARRRVPPAVSMHIFLRNSHVAAGTLSYHRDVAERTKSMQLYSTGILVKGRTNLSQKQRTRGGVPEETTREGVRERTLIDLSRSVHAEVWVAVRVALRFAEDLPGIPHRLALEPDRSVSS